MLSADRNRTLTRAYSRSPLRVALRHRPLEAVADHAIGAGCGAGAPEGWLDAADQTAGDGTLQTPVMRAGGATQATAGKRPTMDSDGGNAGLPTFDFDGVDDCWECGTTVDIGGGTRCGLFAVVNATDTGTTGVVWEYTASATTTNGAYIAFRLDGGNYHPFAVCGDAVAYAGAYLSGDYDGNWGVISSVQDRGGASQLAQVGGEWEGAPFDTTNGLGLASGTYLAGQSSWIGARNNGALLPFGGSLSELVVYNVTLTSAQHAAIRDALKWKWRLL